MRKNSLLSKKNSVLDITLFLILLLSFSYVIFSPLLYEPQITGYLVAGPISTCNYSGSGNWVVSDTCVLTGETIWLNGNLTITQFLASAIGQDSNFSNGTYYLKNNESSIVGGTTFSANKFIHSSTGYHVASDYSTTISATSVDLVGNEASYSPDWDYLDTSVVKFMFDSTNNKMQVFSNITGAEDNMDTIVLYGVDLDNDVSTGSDSWLVDLVWGISPTASNSIIFGCYNTSASGWAIYSTAGTFNCDSSIVTGLGTNATIVWDKTNPSSANVTEMIINFSGTFHDHTVFVYSTSSTGLAGWTNFTASGSTFNDSGLDLNDSESAYTEDWDLSDGVFKVLMSESAHALKVFVNNSGNNAYYQYFFDLDGNASSGYVGDVNSLGAGSEFKIELDNAGQNNLRCLNSTGLTITGTYAQATEGPGVLYCNSSTFNGGYTSANATIYYAAGSNSNGGYNEFTIFISGPWVNKRIIRNINAQGYDGAFTFFNNTIPAGTGGNLSLIGTTLVMNGTANGSVNITNNGALYLYGGTKINSSNASVRYDFLALPNTESGTRRFNATDSFISDAGYAGGTYGIFLPYSWASGGATFRNNTVNRSYGLNVTWASGLTVYNNTFLNTNRTFVYTSTGGVNFSLNNINSCKYAITYNGSDPAVFDNNTISNCFVGLWGNIREGNTVYYVRNNYFLNNSIGANLSYIHNGVFSNNRYENQSTTAGALGTPIGLELYSNVSLTTFSNESIKARKALLVGDASGLGGISSLGDNVFNALNITSLGLSGSSADIESRKDSQTVFFNLRISNASRNNITVFDSSFLNFTNASINTSGISAFDDGVVAAYHYLTVFTGTNATTGLGNVTLNFTSTEAEVFLNSSTDTNGWLNNSVILQRGWDSSSSDLYSPTNISGSISGYVSNYTSANVTSPTLAILLLSSDGSNPTPTPTPTATPTPTPTAAPGGSSPSGGYSGSFTPSLSKNESLARQLIENLIVIPGASSQKVNLVLPTNIASLGSATIVLSGGKKVEVENISFSFVYSNDSLLIESNLPIALEEKIDSLTDSTSGIELKQNEFTFNLFSEKGEKIGAYAGSTEGFVKSGNRVVAKVTSLSLTTFEQKISLVNESVIASASAAISLRSLPENAGITFSTTSVIPENLSNEFKLASEEERVKINKSLVLFEVDKTNLVNLRHVSEAKIRFRIERKYVDDNGGPDLLQAFRKDDNLIEFLPTKLITRSRDEYVFEATSRGLSQFLLALMEEKTGLSISSVVKTFTQAITVDEGFFEGKKAGRFESLTVFGSWLVLLIFIIAMFVVVYFVQSQNVRIKFSSSPKEPEAITGLKKSLGKKRK